MSETDEPEVVPAETPDTVTGDSSDAVTTVISYPQGWSLVERGSWQVSVGPDGLIMLPRHLHPSEVDDFCAAVQAAAPVGVKQRAANEANTTPQPTEEELLAQPTVFVAESGVDPVPGAARMQVAPRAGFQANNARIGRPRPQQDVREPRTAPPVQPPRAGGRHGRKNP